MCSRYVTLVQIEPHLRCYDVKKPAEFDSQLCFISILTVATPEKHFCLMNTSFYVSSVHIFLHLYLIGFWKQVIKKRKKNSFILSLAV